MSKLNKLEQDKKDILKALQDINPKAAKEFIRQDAMNQLAKAEEELRGLKEENAKQYVKPKFEANVNPKSANLNPKEQRQNSVYKHIAKWEHYNKK